MSDETTPLSPLKRALVAIEELQRKLAAQDARTREPIAIVGMGCRFPGHVRSPEAFWHLLSRGEDGVSLVPADRWNVDAFYDEAISAPGKVATRWGGFIDAVDQFDAAHFGVAPREAAAMDPQQRILLEVACEALDDAGLRREAIAGSSMGVYVGISGSDYAWLQVAEPDRLDAYSGSGNAHSVASGRLSYVLDLRGPSLSVDTACSSSLYAVDLACNDLRQRRCDAALAAGVNLLLSPYATIGFSKAGMMAKDGRCKTFDARADGYVRAEGCGVVVLKRLSDAQRAGDRILAVIKGSAVNQDGRTSGLTAPSGVAQRALMRAALERAGVRAADVGFVETHGTGTALGDPIELESLAEVYGERGTSQGACAIGSVKASIGHAEAAAGIAGLIKSVLTLQHGAIAPQLHFRSLNPHVSLEGTRLVVPTSLTPWAAGAAPRHAAVSSFGFSGTNVHLVLGEAPPSTKERTRGAGLEERPLLLSSDSVSGLREVAQRQEQFLRKEDGATVDDICYTASARRTHHAHRLVLFGTTRADLAEACADYVRAPAGAEITQEISATTPSGFSLRPQSRRTWAVGSRRPTRRTLFVFSGQGSQHAGMARDLLANDADFRHALEECDQTLRVCAGWSIVEELSRGGPGLEKTSLAQVAIFAVQVGLMRVLARLGIHPDGVLGHSVGEIAAAHVASMISLHDAVEMVWARGLAMEASLDRGRMLSVELAADIVTRELLPGRPTICVAAINGPSSTVLSGEEPELAALEAMLKERGIAARAVHVRYPFHSAVLDPVLPGLRHVFERFRYAPPKLPFFSAVRGADASATPVDADYWVQNARNTVRFWPAIEAARRAELNVFLEIGPHPVLTAAIGEGLRQTGADASAIATLRRGASDAASLQRALAALHVEGHAVDWEAYFGEHGRITSLPTFPWQHERFWQVQQAGVLEVSPARGGRPATVHPLLGRLEGAASDEETEWHSELSLRALPYLADHRIGDRAIFPATGYIEAALAAAGPLPVRLQDFGFDRVLGLEEDKARRTRITVKASLTGRDFRFSSADAADDAEWVQHAHGILAPPLSEPGPLPDAPRDMGGADSAEALYEELSARALAYGPRFRGIEAIVRGDGEATARIGIARAGDDVALFHPAALDAAFQVVAAAAGRFKGASSARAVYVPVGFRSFELYATPTGTFHARARVDRSSIGPDGFAAQLLLFDDERVLGLVEGLRFQRIDSEAQDDVDRWALTTEWTPRPLEGETKAASRSWLVFADARGVAATLARELAKSGDRVVVVKAAAAYGKRGPDAFDVDPLQKDDVERALKEAYPSTGPTHVVHAWALDLPADTRDAAATTRALETLGCGGLLHVIHGLLRAPWRDKPRLALLTSGAQAVDAGEDVHLAQAALWGLGRVLVHEHSELRCTMIDIAASASEGDLASTVRELRADDDENEIALRGERRLVHRLRRFRASAARRSSVAIRREASYLVTGGFGGVGRTAVRWLADNGAAHVIVVGRSAMTEAASALVEALAKEGTVVEYERVDVASERDMDALFARIDETYPPLRGVFHLAGALDDGILIRLDASRFGPVLAPKVAGSLHLHRHTKERNLDFFVLFSSIASVFGSPGQANYSAANAFLDALAHQRLREGLPALSVNWGTWAGGGMASAEVGRGQRLASRGMKPLPPRKAMSAMYEVLRRQGDAAHGTVAQIAIAAIDFAQWFQQDPRAARLPLVRALAEAGKGGAAHAARDAALLDQLRALAAGAPRRKRIQGYVQGHIAQVLGLDASRIDPQKPLLDLGLDSLMAVELRNRLETNLGITLSSTMVWSFPTVAAVAPHLLEKLGLADEAPPESARAPKKPDRAAPAAADPEDDITRMLERELDDLDPEFLRED